MNKTIKFFINTLLLILLSSSFAQQIEGYISDSETEKAIPHANIVIVGSKIGAAADNKGFYRIEVPAPGSYSLKVSCIGYKSRIMGPITLEYLETLQLDFVLDAQAIPTQNVEIEADKIEKQDHFQIQKLGIQEINPRKIHTVAGALDDVTRTVQLFGSAAPAGDYTSYYAVRGGSPDQNVIMLDGIVLPNPYKLRLVMGGGISIFNPLTTQDVQLVVDNFEAQHGNFISSVMGVESREGRKDRFGGGGVSVNVLSASLLGEGPLPYINGSWIVSARRTYFDLIADRFAPDQSTFPFSWDIDSKLTWYISDDQKLTLKTISNREGTRLDSDIEYDMLFKEKANTDFVTLGYEYKPNNRLIEKVKMAFYDETFTYDLKENHETWMRHVGTYESRIKCLSFKEDFEYRISPRHWLSRGTHISATRSIMDFDANVKGHAFARRQLPPVMSFSETSGHLSTYLDYTFRPVRPLSVRLGGRLDYSSLIEKGDFSPRISTQIQLPGRTQIQLFYGHCYQYPNVLSIFSRDWPINLGLNLPDIHAEKAQHYTLGIQKKWTDDLVSRMEIYYKDIDRLLLPIDFYTFQNTNDGIGYSKGIEFVIQKMKHPHSRFSGMLSYAYGESQYRFANSTLWVPFNFDLRHAASAMLDITVTDRINLNCVGRWTTGYPYNDLIGYMNADFIGSRMLRETKNENRFPNYARLDFRINYTSQLGPGMMILYLDLTNILNNDNMYDIMWHTEGFPDEESEADVMTVRPSPPVVSNGSRLVSRHVYMLPFIPSIGISYIF